MEDERFPCVIVGAGKMGLLHGALANRHELLEVVGMVDSSFQSRMVAKGIGLKIPVFKNIDSAIGATGRGLAIICTPPNSHHPIIKKFLERNWAIFVEKPLTMRDEDSRELVDISSRGGAYTQVGFQLRFNPVISFIKEEMAESSTWQGTPKKIDLEILSPQFIGVRNSSIGLKRGGIEWDLLPHVIDLSNHITGAKKIGDIEIVDADMSSWTYVKTKVLSRGIECNLIADWACSEVRKVELKGAIEFTGGEIIKFDSDRVWKDGSNEQLFHRRFGENPYFEVADQEYSTQMEHLARSVLGSTRAPAADFEAGLLVDEMIEGVVR